MQLPTKPPTPAEYAVIAIGSSAVFILLGMVGLAFSLFAPPAKAEVASALTHYSGWSLVIGLFIGFSYWLFRRLIS